MSLYLFEYIYPLECCNNTLSKTTFSNKAISEEKASKIILYIFLDTICSIKDVKAMCQTSGLDVTEIMSDKKSYFNQLGVW